MRIFRPILSLIVSLSAIVGVNAQGNGPTQPEVATFTPAGTSDMVDPATGDFNYSIPLFDVGGYPVTISYNAGRSMDEQASSVGLGWNLNIGQVTRNMRGIPDDFMGDEIKRTVNLRNNVTIGVGADLSVTKELKLFSWPLRVFDFGAGLSFMYNSYNGFSIKRSANIGMGFHEKNKKGIGLGLSLSQDTQEGTSLGANLSIDGTDNKWKAGLGISYSSRSGLEDISLWGSKKWKKDNALTKALRNSNMSYSFAGTSYTPYSDLRMASLNIMGTFKMGIIAFNIANSPLSFNGFFRSHFLADSDQSKRGYGAIYHQNATEADLVDVNREKDGSISNLRKNMAIPTFTSDIFSVTGHGFTGSFQIRRGEIPVVYDAHIEDVSTGQNIGVDLQAGNIADVGVSLRVPVTLSESGGYDYVDNARTLALDPTTFKYEPYYYKFSGEMVVGDETFYTDVMGGTNLVQNALNQLSTSPIARFNNIIRPSYGMRRNQREIRNNVVYHLTAGEAQTLGLQKKILNYTKNGIEIIERVSGDRQAHHISEITALKEGGIRYVFGLPAYNLSQTSTTYNTNTTVTTEGLISINLTENSIRNGAGLDHFYEQTVIPAYAHSFLLTAVLSPDYQDRTGDGPTPDDFGSYTRFNYTKVYNKFKWQTPETPNRAEFHHGLYGKTNDNKATYIEGEKEVWYIHSIESKEYVAEFTYSDRADVADNNNNKLKKLDRIEVFSLVERRANKFNSSAVPLKKVDFGFDYSLCPNSPTGSNTQKSGKLTLTTLAFSSENSDKGRFSPYKFDYNHTYDRLDYTYNRLAHNDWGTYKPAPAPASAFPVLQRKDFPYIDQTNPNNAEDGYAGMGNLKAITLPSGGKITVTYEADDYAYVQDKPAMNFFPIVGFVDNVSDNFNQEPKKYVVIQVPPNTKVDDFKRNYLKNNLIAGANQEYVLLKTYTMLANDAGGNRLWDWLDTYAKIDINAEVAIHRVSIQGPTYAYIPLVEENVSNFIPLNGSVNPIRKSALNYVKNAYSKELNDRLNASYANPGTFALGMLSSLVLDFDGMASIFLGTNNWLLTTRNVGNLVQLRTGTEPTAFIRLTTPTGIKKGGGLRVRAIEIDDNFNKMTNPGLEKSVYRTMYDYKIEEEKGKLPISSGVASYEPLVGGQENPWRQPEFEENNNFGRVNERQFMEMPFAESYFPAPNVIYRKVKVTSEPVNIPANKKVDKHRPGYTVHEYYTAKEFPTIVKKTVPVSSRLWLPPISLEPYASTSTDKIAYSQGYSIELNDMHGKPKQVTSYSNNNDVTSFTSYKYKTTADNKLNNEVLVIQKDKRVATKSLGLDIEQVIDYRRTKSITTTPGGHVDFDISLAGVFPVFGGASYPMFARHETNFKSATNIKVIRRAGILESVTAMDLGSTVVTKNLAFDGETGAVLLTETQNEFNDPIYNLTIPAHWAYKEMGFAYKNIQGVLPGTVNVNNGIVTAIINGDVDFTKYLCKGDVLASSTPRRGVINKYWVTDVTSSSFSIVDEQGNAPTGDLINAKIIQSGYKNMQSMPVQTITSLQNPIQNNVLVLNTTTKVVDSKAMEYGNAWSPFCTDCGVIPEGTNWYRRNRLGQWRQLKTFAFATDRQNNLRENGTATPKVNLRRDGIYTQFSPYWDWDNPTTASEEYWKVTGTVLTHTQGGNNAWVEANRITKYDHDGNLIESKNALDIYQAQLSGYLNRKTTAVSNNAKYNEIFFDGFEDYNYNLRNGNLKNCGRHFPSKNLWDNKSNTYPNLSKEEAHTGKYALKVTAGAMEFSVEKPCLEDLTPPCTTTSNLIQNGSFENPTITVSISYTANIVPWFHPDATGTTEHETWSSGANGFQAFHQNQFIELNGGPLIQDPFDNNIGHYMIQQQVNVTPGSTFRLSFAHRARRGNDEDIRVDILDLNNTRLATRTFDQSFTDRWVTQSFDFVPNTSPILVRFVSLYDYSYGNLMDNVQLSCVPSVPVSNCVCLPPFRPEVNKKHVISAWVKVSQACTKGYEGKGLEVSFDGQSPQLFKPSGAVIEGWQRIYGEFTTPPSYTKMSVKLHPMRDNKTAVYFDDLRIHPFLSSFKSYVYDDVNNKLSEELDDNNYFTRYEYDQSGALERVKKETERGVMMVQESRAALQKK